MEITRLADTHEGSWTSPDDASDPAGCGRAFDGRMMRERIPFNNTLFVDNGENGKRRQLMGINSDQRVIVVRQLFSFLPVAVFQVLRQPIAAPDDRWQIPW